MKILQNLSLYAIISHNLKGVNTMTAFFINMSTWGTPNPQIIDDEVMCQSERGKNYLNPDDFDFLCEAETARDAEKFYFEEFSNYVFDHIAECTHP